MQELKCRVDYKAQNFITYEKVSGYYADHNIAFEKLTLRVNYITLRGCRWVQILVRFIYINFNFSSYKGIPLKSEGVITMLPVSHLIVYFAVNNTNSKTEK